jgi:hypothetical protein
MVKSLMGILTLGAALAPASAQSVWQFSYTGFFLSLTDQFEAQRSERGLFAGSDDDGNGLLERPELTRFMWEQVDYIHPEGGHPCALLECALNEFSYDLRTGQLDFHSEWSYHDEMAFSRSRTVTGDRISFYGSVGGGEGSGYAWLWTDQTVFGITPAPVPEPTILPMLVAGAGVLGLAARRSRAMKVPSPLRVLIGRDWY